METPSTQKKDKQSDTLIEFVELLAKIETTPEKIKKNSDKMTVGTQVITY